MLQDLQKATLWKRFSAFLFDFIILITLVVGIASLLSGILGYDTRSDRLDEIRLEYAAKYGIDPDITTEEYAALTPEQIAVYEEASRAYAADEESAYLYSYLLSASITMVSISLLLGFLILELAVPLLLKNGQTLGKKIFGVALMRQDAVRVSPMILFIRAILCKYTLETMIPVLIAMMAFFGVLDPITGVIILLGIAVLQIALVLSSRHRQAIHDMLACTVAVDMATQMIFDSQEAKTEYLARVQAEAAEKAPY